MIKFKKSAIYFGVAAKLWSLATWLYFSPPILLIGHPVILYGLVLFTAGLISAVIGISVSLKLKRNLMSKKKAFFLLFLLTVILIFFPPDITRLYYPPAPVDGLAQSKSIVAYPIGLPEANAACSYGCIINVCVRWIPGPSPQCPRPGPGGGCCTDYEQECDPECGDPDPPPAASPPSITGIVTCNLWGSNGWCRSNARLVLTASDPQGYSLTVTGNAGGTFSCSGSCTKDLPSGSGTATYTVIATQSGKSNSGSSGWKFDPQLPIPSLAISGTDGSNDWYISPVNVTATGSDSLSGLAGVSLSVDGGPSLSTATLDDGAHEIVITAVDTAGNTGSITKTVSVDATKPILDVFINGASGLDEWFVSPVTVTAIDSDATSGIAATQYRINGGAWQEGTSTRISIDGEHIVDIRSTDYAGNTATGSLSFKIDLTPPSSSFTSPLPTSMVKGTVQIMGTSLEEISGLSKMEISFDDDTWLPMSTTSGNWSSVWDTTQMPNGTYAIFIRGTDRAGNREDPVRIDMVVGNISPQVDIPLSSMISDPLPISIRPGLIPIVGGQIVIHDPKNRWPARRFTYDTGAMPTLLLWDRRFRDSTLAPPGRYLVVVEAWDKFGNTGQDTGTIIIPDGPTATITSTSTRTTTPSPSPTARPTRTPLSHSGISAQPPAVAIVEQTSIPKSTSEILWPAIGFLGLIAGLASSSLSDPRPHALKQMGKAITRIMDQGKINNWQGEKHD